jgi:hypothetical protein
MGIWPSPVTFTEALWYNTVSFSFGRSAERTYGRGGALSPAAGVTVAVLYSRRGGPAPACAEASAGRRNCRRLHIVCIM